LVLAVLAIGLAAIPPHALDRNMPNPLETPRVKMPPVVEREGGMTFKFKTFSVNLGGKAPKAKPGDAPPEVALSRDPLRWFTIAAISCALVAFVVSLIGHIRERQTTLTISSVGCCVVAISWQYVVFGILFGIAAAVAFLVLLFLAPALAP
jgi:hypothetical protein